jgi:catechol 2,3-dioxygenase-like lactoylglutathione lyase family enzyme
MPRWVASRVARPARDLERSIAFYRDLLGLSHRGGFTDHDGYDGVFFALPGGGELELTSGPADPRPGTEEDLLVLYVATSDEVEAVAIALVSAGVRTVPAANPYWNRWGRTFLDPDGHRIVVAAIDAVRP